ncbi:MAG: hypothetical protein LBB89_13865 [Treponema sp.]|jgi:hypothetical protein|nr:hypothetical protein [Treponema sp.]
MKKQSMFLSAALMVLAIALTAFCVAGCGGDDPGSGPTGSVIKLGDLPAYPSGTTPATAQNVDSILKELAESGIVESVYGRMDEIVYSYHINPDYYVETIKDGDDYIDIYDLKDVEDDDKTFKASGKVKRIQTESENIAKYSSGKNNVIFTTSDYYRYFFEAKMKGKTTTNITVGSVTGIAGGTLVEEISTRDNMSVTKAGNIDEAKFKLTSSGKYKDASGFTVTTSKGGVKVILDMEFTDNFSVPNISIDDYHDGDIYDSVIPKCSGSLKVYGEGTAPLKTVTINDYETFKTAMKLIGILVDYYYEEGEYGGGGHMSSIAPSLMRKAPKL